MNAVIRTRICLVFNLVTLIAIVSIISIVGNGKYLHFGPSEDLSIIGVKIDTWERWAIVNVMIVFISISDTFINEWGMPFISFRIYDPDCKVIKDVGPVELQLLANGMYFCWAVKNLLYTLCYVSQLDFALFRVISSEITSIFTIRGLIKEKEFKNTENEEDTISQNSTDSHSSLHSVKSDTSQLSRRSKTKTEKNSEITPLLSVQIQV